jgi:hypothetical protein
MGSRCGSKGKGLFRVHKDELSEEGSYSQCVDKDGSLKIKGTYSSVLNLHAEMLCLSCDQQP